MRCAVYGCNSDNQSANFQQEIQFFRFPKCEIFKKQWIIACCRSDNFNVNNSRVCSLHFGVEDYKRDLKYELLNYTTKNARKLKSDAVPGLQLPKRKTTAKELERSKRIEKRNTKKLVEDILQVNMNQRELTPSSTELTYCPTTSKSVGINTDNEDEGESIDQLKSELIMLRKEKEAFKKLFSDKQIQKIVKPNARVLWSVEDISQAISIYSAGPRAYRLLLKKKYPYPAVSTLRSWTKKIKVVPGILRQVLSIIKNVTLAPDQRICVLAFDEMKIREGYAYDKVNDELLKPFRYVQVIMMRGLIGNWKQPIFFYYDCKMSKKILFDVIQLIEDTGFYVCAVVSDLGGSNQSLYKELGCDYLKPWFLNPAEEHKIYVLADTPHLLKLIRNHFLDSGFIFENKEINKNIIEKLLNITSPSDLRITYKISMENLTVQGPGRQKVKLAAKLFSHTVSEAINRCGTMGHFSENENWIECSKFFKLVNDWFDCFNVRIPASDSRARISAFGLNLTVQNKILDDMSNCQMSLRNKGQKSPSLRPYQKGIIGNSYALKLLFADLKEKYSIDYILTYRLNQDVLENFFGILRAKGGLHDHPDALEFRYRLRSYILGRNEGLLSVGANVEEDKTPDGPMDNVGEILLTGNCLTSLSKLPEDQMISINEEENDFDDLKYDAIEHVAGWICYKLKLPEYETSSSSTFTWTDHLSEGGLIKPSEALVKEIQCLESIFNHFNGDTLNNTKNYLKQLLDLSKMISCSDKIKLLFFKSRMYFRIKHLNEALKNSKQSKKENLVKLFSPGNFNIWLYYVR